MLFARWPRSAWAALARGVSVAWFGALFGACARFDFDLLQVSSSAAAAGGSGSGGSGTGGAPAGGGDGSGGTDAAGAGGAAGTDAAGAGGAVGADAGPGTGGSGGDPLAPCAVLGPFGAAEPITGLGSGAFFSPSSFDAGLALIFASAAPGDLFSARRSSRLSAAFGDVRPLEVNSEYDEVTPWASADGLVLLFASNRPGSLSPRDLMQSTRATLDDPFGTPTFLTELNTAWTENLPILHDAGRTLLFSSERPGGAGSGTVDLWRASRAAASGPFGNATPLVELNSSADDSGGSLAGDGLRIYFTSERAGGAGGRDLWFADRAEASAPFSTPQNLVELNGASDEADPSISVDGRELFFATTRAGSAQIWHAWRTCLSP